MWAWNNHTQTYAMNILQVIVSIHRLLGQFVSFCVPLIILGFICQNRHKCRKSFRSKSYYSIYFFNSCCYYISVAGYALVPQHGITSADAVERAIPDAVFQLNIPQVMPSVV